VLSGTGLTGSPSSCPTPISLGGTLIIRGTLPVITLV
jgi:hypothetical protein